MADKQPCDTHEKALAINFDQTIYGTFAEIGAGQEVARWFLTVGGASGTVARTISAYDMAFSDAIYGKVGRYVSRERIEGMLDHEFGLLLDRLGTLRTDARFFAFADTISARNFAGTNEPHGWVGVRFQTTPHGEPNDVILHLNLLDASNQQQQEAVGILGVNLVHAVFHRRERLDDLLPALVDGLSADRIEIDLVVLRGAALEPLGNRAANLELVQHGLAEGVTFPADARLVPPSELLRKRPLMLAPGVFAYPEPIHAAMLGAALSHMESDIGPQERPPLPVFVLSGRHPSEESNAPTPELAARVDALTATGFDVLVSRRPEVYRMVQYAKRYTTAPIRLVIGSLTLADIFHAGHYRDLEGQLIEALARLFAYNVRMYVHPMPVTALDRLAPDVAKWIRVPEGDGMVTLEHIEVPSPTSHLLAYLVESGFLRAIPPA